MLFKVTHISARGKLTRMRVEAPNNADAMDQVERAYGDARVMFCVNLARRSQAAARLRVAARREGLCA
jgi:hypothetical protein